MNITWRGNSFQMSWCLQCHRAPERYIYDLKDPHEEAPRQQVFDLYWKLQANGTKGMSEKEMALVRGKFDGSDKPEDVAKGKEMVKKLGIKVQQLSDCNVCHR